MKGGRKSGFVTGRWSELGEICGNRELLRWSEVTQGDLTEECKREIKTLLPIAGK